MISLVVFHLWMSTSKSTENAECHKELTDDEIVETIITTVTTEDDPEDESVEDAGSTDLPNVQDAFAAVDSWTLSVIIP